MGICRNNSRALLANKGVINPPRQASLTDEDVRKYLFTAVAHHARKELRRRGRRPTAPLEAVGEIADAAAPPEERAASEDDRRLARDLLASLPARRRAVMLLRYGCGLDPSQVCALVKGLSPRAYRKEITRGVDELTAKLQLVERGAWCADREPLLKAFAAGIASEEEQRQARQHLSRCRDCSELVARLTGHLHDLGSALTMPAALEGMRHGGTLQDHLAGVVDRVRSALPGPAGGPGDATESGSSLLAAGGLRGGGAAGAGVLTKIAGLGVGGKLAAACLAGGAVATTCAATGLIGPLPIAGIDHQAKQVAQPRPTVHPARSAGDRHPAPIAPRGGSAVEAIQAEVDRSPSPEPRQPPPETGDATATVTTTASAPPPPAPIAPSTPPVEQQFGVAAAADATSASTAPSSSASPSGGDTTSGGSATQQEFGP